MRQTIPLSIFAGCTSLVCLTQFLSVESNLDFHGAPSEVEQYRHFQYLILNDDINRASAQLASVIYAERARRERQEVTASGALADFARVGALR